MAQSYKVKESDTLYGIAEQFYGDGNEREKIYQANQAVISSPSDRV